MFSMAGYQYQTASEFSTESPSFPQLSHSYPQKKENSRLLFPDGYLYAI